MKYGVSDVKGEVILKDDNCTVTLNKDLESLTVRTIRVRPSNSRTEHCFTDCILHFISGKGEMDLDGEIFTVNSGDYVLINRSKNFTVRNTGIETIAFNCINGE